MKIELRKFTANEKFSEETLMFRAEIYLDGKKVGFVENEGRGGSCNAHYLTAEAGEQVRAYVKTLPPHDDPYWHETMAETLNELDTPSAPPDVRALAACVRVAIATPTAVDPLAEKGGDWPAALERLQQFMEKPRSVDAANGGLLSPEARSLLERLGRSLYEGPFFSITEDSFYADLAEKMQQAKHEKRSLAKRQKFAAAAKVRGMVAFYAEWSSGAMRTEVMFEVRPVYDCSAGSMRLDDVITEAATKYATAYAAKKKVAGALVKVEMLRSAP